MYLSNWSPQPPKWSKENYKLLIQDSVKEPTKVSLEYLIKNSKKFPIKFPIDTGRCDTLRNYTTPPILERNINSVYPVIHENALELCCKFILHKRSHGTAKEKKFYKNMTILDFINRLLTKRAVMFVGVHDHFILLNKKTGAGNWEDVGTEKEKSPLTLKECLSYDEIKLSVFLSVSSYTYFVNAGDRKNMAKYSTDRNGIEDEGIIIGLIGPRMVKRYVMEYQEVVINDKQNTVSNGYGTRAAPSVLTLLADFYEEVCRDYEETKKFRKSLSPDDKRFGDIRIGEIFDNHVYFKRLTFSIDTLLLEANYRAKLKEKTAFVHVVGLGLGVWRISNHQDKIYMEAFEKRISYLADKLTSTSDICFSYINHDKCGQYQHGDIIPVEGHPTSGIKIHICRRNPHEKLTNEDAGKLLVVSYAWDGNSLPGNEYWEGCLGNSSDSAAASSTQITELHNPHINPLVCADNLRVITGADVVTFKKYQETIGITRGMENIQVNDT